MTKKTVKGTRPGESLTAGETIALDTRPQHLEAATSATPKGSASPLLGARPRQPVGQDRLRSCPHVAADWNVPRSRSTRCRACKTHHWLSIRSTASFGCVAWGSPEDDDLHANRIQKWHKEPGQPRRRFGAVRGQTTLGPSPSGHRRNHQGTVGEPGSADPAAAYPISLGFDSAETPSVQGAAQRTQAVAQRRSQRALQGSARPDQLAEAPEYPCNLSMSWKYCKVIDRLIRSTVEDALRRQAAVALIGPRQVGKTTLALGDRERRGCALSRSRRPG